MESKATLFETVLSEVDPKNHPLFDDFKDNITNIDEDGKTCLIRYFELAKNWSPDTANKLLEAGIALNK